MRVVITGMGGELGTRVANLLEADEGVEAIAGLDLDPPRRRLSRAEFYRVDPRDRTRAADIIKRFEPTALVHLGVYEPFARSSPKSAIERTANGTIAALTAAAWAGALDRIVVRSGIEIYGRRRGSPRCPDEDVQPDPTSPFGHALLHTERVARDTAFQVAAPATLLRFAPLVGPHFPSPLGRYLRLPVLPFSIMGDPPFSVLHQEDAARAVVAAVREPFDGPVNVVGPGSVTASQAARIGARVPLGIMRPLWRPTSMITELAGSPVAEHILELLTRGRTADGWRCEERLGVRPQFATLEVIEQLYEWAQVTYIPVGEEAA